jgi:hypothetical protein
VNYLDELLAGYRQGICDSHTAPSRHGHHRASAVNDPRQRGKLLALRARAIAELMGHKGSFEPVQPMPSAQPRATTSETASPSSDSQAA